MRLTNNEFHQTRSERIAAGDLVDVTYDAKGAGFFVPVALTRQAWEQCVRWSEEDSIAQEYADHEHDRLWTLLFMACRTAQRAERDSHPAFRFPLHRVARDGHSRHATMVELRGLLHAGEHGETVLTVALAGEV